MRDLKVTSLQPNRIAPAYPLIQAALPSVSLPAWMAYARAQLGDNEPPRSGILAIVSEQGYISGLSSYRVAASLQHGLSLTADHFVALDMFGRDAVVRALADAIEALARAESCAAVHTILHESTDAMGSSSMRPILSGRGHYVDAVRLCKNLSPESRMVRSQAITD